MDTEKLNQKPDWLNQLWRIKTTSSDDDKKEIASILIFALAVELERIKRIKELADRLLLDYQLTFTTIFLSGEFIYVGNYIPKKLVITHKKP